MSPELIGIGPDVIKTAKEFMLTALLLANCLGGIIVGVQALLLFMRPIDFPIDIADQYHLEDEV